MPDWMIHVAQGVHALVVVLVVRVAWKISQSFPKGTPLTRHMGVWALPLSLLFTITLWWTV